MAVLSKSKPAPGGPGADPVWAQGNKDGVGTARGDSSPVWFTLASGIVTEVYYPDVDMPQIRDLQLLVTDGATFFHDGRRDFQHDGRLVDPAALAFEITSTAIGQPYKIVQTVITDPFAPCLLVHYRIDAAPAFLAKLRVFVLLAPHVRGFGRGNSGFVASDAGQCFLAAHRGDTWLALGADSGFRHVSCGFVGVNDGWTDIVGNQRAPQFDFDCAINGNIALTGEVDLSKGPEFTVGLGFGEGDADSPNKALVIVRESLSYDFSGPHSSLQTYLDRWTESTAKMFKPAANTTSDGDVLFHISRNVLLAHEDKVSSGALVASLSLPWGEIRGDQDGGYHLVWPRDMCQSATALLAAGELDLPLRGLIYLATSQLAGGGFDQNFYIDGTQSGQCEQLDEFSFPIILAYRLRELNALRLFDVRPMVLKAAGAIIANGPMTKQERWEENEGYSPSSLAANIAGLVCASTFVGDAGGPGSTSQFLLEYADWLETKIDDWCVTTAGTLHPAIKKHIIRMLPTQVKSGWRNPTMVEDPNTAMFPVRNRGDLVVPAREVVDGGFLELVRYGIRSATDPLIMDSVTVIDYSLKDVLPGGPCWRRYTQDGYGQRDDGGPFQGTGVGRPWPLLTGERGHYELAAGRDPRPYLKAMENFASKGGLLAEQLWNRTYTPAGTSFVLGGPTGSAVPLAWAHAEYIKLVRSASDGKVFDLLKPVADRYSKPHPPSNLEVWNFDRQFTTIKRGKTVRIPLAAPFQLRWTLNGWLAINDTRSVATSIGINYVDVPTDQAPAGSVLVFTFLWLDTARWQGQNFSIAIV